jgi:hypothetical protein
VKRFAIIAVMLVCAVCVAEDSNAAFAKIEKQQALINRMVLAMHAKIAALDDVATSEEELIMALLDADSQAKKSAAAKKFQPVLKREYEALNKAIANMEAVRKDIVAAGF